VLLYIIIFTATVLSVVTYALHRTLDNMLSKADKARLDSLFRKAFKRGFRFHTFSMEELISAADINYFVKSPATGIAYIHSSSN